MRGQVFVAALVVASLVGSGASRAQSDPNPAMNAPDKQAWELFLEVNASAATPGNNDALFETWANDGDTFRPSPVWPSGPSAKIGGPRAIGLVRPHPLPGRRIKVVPGGKGLVSEETRRNRPDFDFIVQHDLYKVSGLIAAFKEGKTLTFPIDSIEVKANWVEVDRLKEFNGFSGTPAEAAKRYHVNSVGGRTYALVAFHIISKLVPNWTWATFEQEDNPGRCDVIGCRDGFGAEVPYVAPRSPVESRTHYPDCAKSAALKALFAKAHIDPAFVHYCLKGAQADFTDATGLAIRVGNSVTEQGFVAQASCMTCHGRAAFDASGHATSFAGFDPLSAGLPLGPSNTGNAPVGALHASWFWVPPGPPYKPVLADEQGLARAALPADFVWSIPFCAIDDTAKPPQTVSRFCANK